MEQNFTTIDDPSNMFVSDLFKLEKDYHDENAAIRVQVSILDQMIKTCDKSLMKELRRKSLELKTTLNLSIRSQEAKIADLVFQKLESMEAHKVNGYLPDTFCNTVKELYLLLSRQGRLNVRYVKLPKCWLSIGLFAGILEELVVILRTPSQIGIGDTHLHTIADIIKGMRKFNAAEAGNPIRFLFMTKLFERNEYEIQLCLEQCVQFQGESRRIGIYRENNNGDNNGDPLESDNSQLKDVVVNDVVYLYAIQGVYGGITLDPRVVNVLTPETAPPFAIHFTKEPIALSIWNNTPTNGLEIGGKLVPSGTICKFDRPIHGLTCVERNSIQTTPLLRSSMGDTSDVFQIATTHTGIRDRMVHGINDTVSRPKYQAGLVIDLKRLCAILAPGMVMINELGTLLVFDDIPHECLITCLHTNNQLSTFWRL